MRKLKEIKELQERLDKLERRIDDARVAFDDYQAFDAQVAHSIQRILNTHGAITVKHYLNDKEIKIELVKNQIKALDDESRDLERLLEQIKEIKKKYGHKEQK